MIAQIRVRGIRHPDLTIAAALSLGLAIGAQTSVYCLTDALSCVLPPE